MRTTSSFIAIDFMKLCAYAFLQQFSCQISARILWYTAKHAQSRKSINGLDLIIIILFLFIVFCGWALSCRYRAIIYNFLLLSVQEKKKKKLQNLNYMNSLFFFFEFLLIIKIWKSKVYVYI